MTKRFLRPRDIPQSLWDGDNLLRLPQPLRDAYNNTLRTKGLLEEALRASPKGYIGGESAEETDQHFAHRFDGSCARVELAFLDPKDDLKDASNCLVRAFSGGSVRLLDIPCGSGAASAALLTTVAELRRQNIMPRQPLEVFLTGGDISDNARCNADLILSELQQTLRNQGIFLKFSLFQWDISDAGSTTSLLNKWLEVGPECKNSVLIVANFSGFLGADGNLKKVEERVGELFRWARVREATAAWLEPPMDKESTNQFRDWFSESFSRLMGWLGRPAGTNEQLSTHAKFVQPIRDSHISVRLRLHKLEDPKR